MMREFVSTHTLNKEEDLKQTIALVGKARATAGALNLSHILLHHVLVGTCFSCISSPEKNWTALPECTILPSLLATFARGAFNITPPVRGI
jgi:hypothetical protein